MALVDGTRSRIVISRNATFLEKLQDSGASSRDTGLRGRSIEADSTIITRKILLVARVAELNMLQDLPAWNVRYLKSHGMVTGATWMAQTYILDLDGNTDAQDTALDSPHRKFSAT